MEKHHSDLFQEKARELLGQKSVLPPEQYYALIESFLKDVCERYENRDLNRIVYALDASNEGIWDYQVTSGKMYMNNRWYTMLGYEPGELPASMNTFRRLCHVQDMLKNIKYISKVLLLSLIHI